LGGMGDVGYLKDAKSNVSDCRHCCCGGGMQVNDCVMIAATEQSDVRVQQLVVLLVMVDMI